MVFLASPSNQESADNLSTRSQTRGSLSLGNNSVSLNRRLQCFTHAKGDIKGVWVKEAVEGPCPDISALTSTCWVGLPGHLEVMPEWWPCGMEPIARPGCSQTISESFVDRLKGGNSRPTYVSCPSWTQAELGPSSSPHCTFSVHLSRTRGSSRSLLTQTLGMLGHRRDASWVGQLLSTTHFILVVADAYTVLSRCQALFSAHSCINLFIPLTTL